MWRAVNTLRDETCAYKFEIQIIPAGAEAAFLSWNEINAVNKTVTFPPILSSKQRPI